MSHIFAIGVKRRKLPAGKLNFFLQHYIFVETENLTKLTNNPQRRDSSFLL